MFPLFLLVFLQVPLVSVSSYNFTADIKKLTKDVSCNRKCLFDQTEITLKTMDRWPTECTDVCAILTLNQNCDLSVAQLKTLFERMSFLTGALRIENTSFTSLSFLPSFMMSCELLGISIVNNSQLVDVKSVVNMDIQYRECAFRMSDNQQLDARSLCESDSFKDRLGLQIFGNSVDCGCPGGKMDSSTVGRFSNCEMIQGNLVITDISDPLTPLKVKQIIGDLTVKKTNLTSLSFLKNLEEVKTKSQHNRVVIDIHDNYQMTSLGLKALKNLTNTAFDRFTINLQRLHSNFCLTVDEMRVVLDYDAQFSNIEAIYCKDPLPIHGPKMCVFERMSSLESDCEHILGDILIESGDEDYVDKLKTVTHVFGSVTVRNTSLDYGKFLKKLERVASLNASLPAIQFLFNTNFKKLTIPSLQHIVASVNRVVFEGNGPDIFEKTSDCMRIQYQGQSNVTYNGATCKAVNKTRVNSVIPYDDDYSESSHQDWIMEYEGVFYYLDPTDYQEVYDTMDRVNDVASVIGFIVNIFHLIVLFQKELRNNFIYIMMIGISICDTLLVSTFIIEFLLNSGWVYTRTNCGLRPYSHELILVLDPAIQSMTRRCSSLLAFSMALFRTCSVMFPMSGTVVSFSRPNVALSLVIGLFALCIIWDFSLLIDCEISVTKSNLCDFNDNTLYESYCPAFVNPSDFDDEDDPHIQWYKAAHLIDGFSTIIIGLLYIIVTIGLIIQLRSAHKRRKSLKSEKSDNTSLLVTLMALTFFVSALVIGSLFIIDEYVLKYFSWLQLIEEGIEIGKFTLLIINSTAHCLICFFMSSQYRNVAKRVFWRRKKESFPSAAKNSFVPDMATISTVKTSESSTKKTF